MMSGSIELNRQKHLPTAVNQGTKHATFASRSKATKRMKIPLTSKLSVINHSRHKFSTLVHTQRETVRFL